MKKLLVILLSVIMLIGAVPVFAENTAIVSSAFNGLTGVPVCADIPLEFSQSVTLTAEDITVLPKTSFTLEGSGTNYTVNFTGDMKAGNIYTIKVGNYGTITYTTAYGTDLEKIDVDTLSVAGRTAEFSKALENMTLKINFTNKYGLPDDSKFIELFSDNTYVSAIRIMGKNNKLCVQAYRYLKGSTSDSSKIGPASLIEEIEYTDTVYITYKNNTVYPFSVSSDGSVRYGTQWSYSSQDIAGSTFNKMSINSAVFGVEVGNGDASVASDPEITITDADSTGAVSASYTLNRSDAVLICAVYDVSTSIPMLLDVEIKEIDSANGTTTFALNTNSKTSLKYKLFAFSDMESIVPIVPAYEYPLN